MFDNECVEYISKQCHLSLLIISNAKNKFLNIHYIFSINCNIVNKISSMNMYIMHLRKTAKEIDLINIFNY